LYRIDETQACDAAARFLEDIGEPCGIPTLAILFKEERRIKAYPFDVPVWRIGFKASMYVDISTETGNVMRYEGRKLTRNRMTSESAQKMLTRESAIERANEIVPLLNITDTLVLNSAELKGSSWKINWQRYCDGVPYYPDRLTIEVIGLTGRIASVTWLTPTSSQPPLTSTVDEQQAIAIAEQFFKDRGLTAKFGPARMYYTNPGSFMHEVPLRPRYLTWHMKPVEDRGDKVALWFMWIDATDGSVLSAWVDIIYSKPLPAPTSPHAAADTQR